MYTQIIIKKNFIFFSAQNTRMSRSSINLNNKNIKKSDFYENKKIFNIDIDVNEILVSKKEQYGKYNSFKYFIGYNDNDVIKAIIFRAFINDWLH